MARQRKCSALNCKNKTRTPGLKFFQFPLHSPRRLKRWLSAIKREDWQPSHLHSLCIDHFEEQDIDRTGRWEKLRKYAVPTKFSFPDETKKRKVSVSTKGPSPDSSASSNGKPTIQNEGPCQASQHTPRISYSKTFVKWSIITDDALVQIDSFPYFFHGDYCKPQAIQWAPDNFIKTDHEQSGNIIEVKKPWQWLGLDVRGPLPATLNDHKYILTVTDYYSKWLEALPMQSCISSEIVRHIEVIISHFGYPFRILSRLPQDIVEEINRDLKKMLDIRVSLVVHHQQTGTVDVVTQHLTDSMVADLIAQHGADWDVHLPAKVFSLCFREHSETKERPFSVLCCKGHQPVHAPRGMNDYDHSKIKDSAFVVH